MSICAIAVEPERALLAVDTAVEIIGLPQHVEGAKLHLLPHAGIAIVGLGSTAVAQRAFQKLQRPGVGVGLDLAADHLSGWLDAIVADEAERAECRASAALVDDGNLVYLLGWSDQAARMRAMAYLQAPGARTFTAHEIARWTVQPRDPDADLRAPESLDELAELARGAVAYGKASAPGMPYGGRLVLAEITRGGMRTALALSRKRKTGQGRRAEGHNSGQGDRLAECNPAIFPFPTGT